jgi:uncharacterized protein YdaL
LIRSIRTSAVRHIALLLSVALLFSCFLPGAGRAIAMEQPVRVLLLYDSLAKGTPREGNIALLQRLLAAYSVQVTTGRLDHYSKGRLQQFERVVTVINEEFFPAGHAAYLEDLAAYQGGVLQIGAQAPVTVAGLQNASAPAVEKGSANELKIARTLKDWLGINREGRSYVLFKEVYPFSDLELLRRLADQLYEGGIPFMVSVRPVFTNTDYPAMKRYAEALKYVQAKNGSILIQAPVVMLSMARNDFTLKEKMEGFINTLAGYGVAPLGIGAEMYWSYDAEYAGAGMGFFDSAVLFPDVEPQFMKQTDTSKAFASSLYSVTPDFLEQLDILDKRGSPFPMDTALTLDLMESPEQLETVVKRLKAYWISFSDYRDGAHRTETAAHKVYSRDGSVSIDGSRLNPDYKPEEVSADYEYVKKTEESFKAFFSAQNNIFIVIILASLAVFGGFFIIGRKLYRRKYLK